jgi:hypothetical protein
MKLPILPSISPTGAERKAMSASGIEAQLVFPDEVDAGQRGSEQAAVKGHPPFPDGEKLHRVRDVEGEIVKQDVAQPAAEDHA